MMVNGALLALAEREEGGVLTIPTDEIIAAANKGKGVALAMTDDDKYLMISVNHIA